MLTLRILAPTLALAVLATVAIVPSAGAQTRPSECSGVRNNDDCDRILAESADRELGAAVDARTKEIGTGSSDTVRIERAKGLYVEAAKQWMRYRDAQCDASAAADILISARTLEGLNARCRYTLTTNRIGELRAGAPPSAPTK